jgi:uncharacterized repeat protein (TIGR03803 family)
MTMTRQSLFVCLRRAALLSVAVGLLLVRPSTVSAQSYGVVYEFFSVPGDGFQPYSEVIADDAGNLYGGTPFGAGGYGAVYRIDPAGNETLLAQFAGGRLDGGRPYGALLRDGRGNLWGTTALGGVSNLGTLFRIDSLGHRAIVHHFFGGPDGAHPFDGLVRDAQGNLYGTTRNGGAWNSGTIYRLDPAGSYSILHTFTRGAEGGFPTALTIDRKGNLYGATSIGGPANAGVVFKRLASGQLIVLHGFAGGAGGATPYAGVTLDRYGNIYGTTAYGGTTTASYPTGAGVVYRVSAKGRFTVLHAFSGGLDGALPFGGVTLDSAGNAYGTATYGGANNAGTAFKIDTSRKLSLLHTFAGPADGANPNARPRFDGRGALVGTTTFGGTYNGGVVYRIVP